MPPMPAGPLTPPGGNSTAVSKYTKLAPGIAGQHPGAVERENAPPEQADPAIELHVRHVVGIRPQAE